MLAALFRFSIVISLLLCVSHTAYAAPKKVLLEKWQDSNESGTTVIDHSLWQSILDQYIVRRQRQTYFDYAAVQPVTKQLLNQYITTLTSINPSTLNRQEQFAYWVNLYNAATIQLVLQHYPIKSITKIGKGFFSFGPWNDKILTINQKMLSLNDIEHGILRPIYNDPRIHYVINCASIGCPNLQGMALTAANSEMLLDKAAREFINHTRAVRVTGDRLILSTIFDWFSVDFGANMDELFSHLSQYAEPPLLRALERVDINNVAYEYDWSLNRP